MRKKRKLKIAQLHWGFPPMIGGVETHLAIMMPVMVRGGHVVSLLTGSVEGTPGNYVYEGVKIFRTPLMDLNWLFKRGLVGIEDEWRKILSEFFKETKPDIVHVHNMHYFSKVHVEVLQEICKEKKLPMILTAHNVWDEILFLKLTRDIEWDHIIAVSHYIKKEIIGIGVDDRKVTVVHHGINHKTFHKKVSTKAILKKFPQLKGRQVIIHPARIGIAKGCDVSIKALNIIRNHFPDILMVLAGSKNIIDWGATQQKDIAYFVNLIRHFNLQDNVLIDSYQLTEMPALYACSQITIYPSTAQEPFGLTMLEAMSSEKPMIVTKAGGMPEIIRDSINGFVIPPKDFEALADRSMLLLQDQKLRNRLGWTGRQMVEQQYTTKHMTENTLKIYRKFV